jgi:outer membrane immunogenic protein
LTARVIGEAANNYWVTTHIDASGIMTVRGRLGVTPVPAVLLYATGGAAVTSFTVSNHFVDDASTIIGLTVNSIGQSNATRKKWGWTAGGGAEWAVARSWTIRAEYLYFDFGSIGTIARVIQTDVAPDDPNHLATSASLTVRMVRVGFNARF